MGQSQNLWYVHHCTKFMKHIGTSKKSLQTDTLTLAEGRTDMPSLIIRSSSGWWMTIHRMPRIHPYKKSIHQNDWPIALVIEDGSKM